MKDKTEQTEQEQEFKSSALNTIFLKVISGLLVILLGLLSWLGMGIYTQTRVASDAIVLINYRMDQIEKNIDAKLGKAVDRRDFEFELVKINSRLSSIEARQSGFDLELQKFKTK